MLGFIISLFFLNNSLESLVKTSNENISIANIKSELTFINIFYSNLKIIFINVIGGITFGMLTYLNLIYNGMILGYILKIIYAINIKFYLLVIPHSFEIIGFLIAGAVGIELGYYLFKYVFLDVKIKLNLKKNIIDIILSIAIIFLSALIEVYITPIVI